MRIQVAATRVSKASRDSIWKAVEDLESWPKWFDSTSKNYMNSIKIVSREGNSVVCDEDEVSNGLRVKHRDRMTFYPKEKITGEVLEGPDIGSWSWSFTETTQGTRIDLNMDMEPKTLMFKIGFRINGKKALQAFADNYNNRLSDYAEANP